MIEIRLKIRKINDNPTTGECIVFPEYMALLLMVNDAINFSQVIYVECEYNDFVYSYFGLIQRIENEFFYKKFEMKLES